MIREASEVDVAAQPQVFVIEGGTLVRLFDECREKAGSFSPAQAQRIIQRLA
jgi:hypothetical protein